MVFETLERRIIIEGEIEAVTPLHVGSGKPEFEEGVDLPILKDPSGSPYIPGSSIKGKVRTEVEKIARSSGMFVCNAPTIETMCGSKSTSEEQLCIACRIFGTASIKGGISRASKVKFRDAHIITQTTLMQRTGIAMDREVGSVKAGALYTIEGVPAGAKFNLEIVTENLTDEEFKILKSALKSVEDSALGGHSSRGFGKIKFNIKAVKVRTANYYLGKETEQIIEW